MKALKASAVVETVEKLLLEQRKHGIEYQGFLANHVHWVAMVYTRSGFSEEEVRKHIDNYNARIDYPETSPAETVQDPEKLISDDGKNHETLTACFDKELEETILKEGSTEKGIATFTAARLPAVVKGVGAAAFHPILLLGLGVEGRIPNAVASGLAYMYCRTWREHDDVDVMIGDEKALFTTLKTWSAEVAPKLVLSGSFRKRELEVHRVLLEHSCVVPGEEQLIPALHDMFIFAAAALLASENEFFILHGLTSLWSMYHVVVQDIPRALRAELVGSWLRAFFAAFAAQKFPGLEVALSVLEFLSNKDYTGMVKSLPQPPPEASWEACIAKSATYHDEEHCIKAIWMLREVVPLCPPEVEPLLLHAAHRVATHTPEDRGGAKATLRFAL
eukprot:TRINITY_DN2020_c2_g2_i1.p1 TRINITY_DN2020_c2_g2~~TRINITY_DN2020_c2_g2_i1.p1  ORF type:complete len:390 (+),score=85.69 TRINITY_DN2020_c2_g2_i1:53-1222(+)